MRRELWHHLNPPHAYPVLTEATATPRIGAEPTLSRRRREETMFEAEGFSPVKTPLQFIVVRGPECSSAAKGRCWMKDFYREFCNWSKEMGYTLAQQQRRVRENLEHLEHLGYKVTVMVVTKVTAFSTRRQHSRGRLTTVAIVVVVTKVTAFSNILTTYDH